MTIKYERFNKEYIEETHGRLYMFRLLYKGRHAEVFERAKTLVEKGELIDNLLNNVPETDFNKTPYVVANVSKMIVNVPAILVSRSLGKITTSLQNDVEQIEEVNMETDNEIEGPNDNTTNGRIENVQQELIQQIVENSNLTTQHRTNIVQHQIDGGLVGVPWNGDKGLRIEFKGRDTYFPHEDGKGADICIIRTFEEIEYLHIYRNRMEWDDEAAEQDEDGNGEGVRTEHMLLELAKGGVAHEEKLSPELTSEYLDIPQDELIQFFPGRKRIFIRYMANEKTFMDPLGVSALEGQESKQDEVNWALTRNAMVFERNGKPRIAINKELAAALQKNMVALYGQTAKGKFDHRQLEVVTMDANGKSLEIIQVDITKIGDIPYVKDLIKLMLMETQTSEKAIDFYMDQGGAAAQSGVAKFYDLFLSLIKAEQIQIEYIEFIKGLIEDTLWLANLADPQVKIEKPEIHIDNMIPIERKEVVDLNMAKYAGPNGKSAQSLETTVREINKDKSEAWILAELERLAEDKASDDSTTLDTGRMTVENFLDNPSTRPPAVPPAAAGALDE